MSEAPQFDQALPGPNSNYLSSKKISISSQIEVLRIRFEAE
jgi:hypothetical protein